MGVDVVDGARIDGRVLERDRGGTGRLPAIRPGLDHVVGVRGRAVAHQLGVRDRPAPFRDHGILEHQQGGSLAHDETVALAVERPGGVAGVVVPTGRECPDDVECPKGERAQGDLAATGNGRIHATLAQVAERLAEGDPAGRARIGRGQDRPADVQRDPEVRRCRATEHGQGEVRRDLPDPALEVPRVLVLGVGDPAERRPEVDPDPLGSGGAVGARGESGVLERETAGDQAELAEPVQLPGGLGRHPCKRIEVVDLGRHLAPEGAGIEAVDPLDRRARCPEAGAKRGEPRADRRDQADPRDPDAPAIAHAR